MSLRSSPGGSLFLRYPAGPHPGSHLGPHALQVQVAPASSVSADTPPTPPQITSSSPSHPANSFYYPRLKALPPIARVTLVRLRQSPRAFIPPAMDLAGNDILDSLSGKPGSRHVP